MQRREKLAWATVVVLAVGLTLVATLGRGATAEESGDCEELRYVFGGSAAIVEDWAYTNASGETESLDYVGWQGVVADSGPDGFLIGCVAPGQFASARALTASFESGSVSCMITRNGTVVARETSAGASALVECTDGETIRP
jgi:hypothetical protein